MVLIVQVGNLSNLRKEAAQQLLAQYESLLVFLKSHGALLNACKAELLMDLNDFRHAQFPRSEE